MTTSGTTTWNPDFAEIIEEAYERVGVEVRTGYQFKSARRSLNLLFQEWASRGLNLWTIEQGSLNLLTGVANYTLPTDTIDLIEHVVRQNDGDPATQVDLQIARISVSTYTTIPNKLATGRPIQIFVDRQAEAPIARIWPAPNVDGYKLVYWKLRRMDDTGSAGTNTADMPFRFVPALIAGLAYYLSIKTPEASDKIPLLKQLYDEAFQLAADEDRQRASVRFTPAVGYVTGGGGW
jgi:hypothetical protein